MKNFLAKNWFKLIISIAIFVYLFLFGFEQYRLTKQYGLEQIRFGMICIEKADEKSCLDIIAKFKVVLPF